MKKKAWSLCRISFFTTLALTLILAISPAWASEEWKDPHEITHGQPNGAYISEEVDATTNEDTEMNTFNYIYIPPDPVYEVPNMSDTGFSLGVYVVAAMATGILYLIVSRYAYGKQSQ